MIDPSELQRRRKAALAIMNPDLLPGGVVRDGEIYQMPLCLRDHDGDGISALDGMTVTDADIFDAVGNDPKIHHVLGMAASTNPREVMDAAQNLSALACGYIGRSVSVTNEAERVALKRAADVLINRSNAILARTS